MFSLIITIIAIALVAALAVASIYYGGSAFTQGGAKAEAAALVNNAMQVSAANVLYKADNAGSNAGTVLVLTDNDYLASAPPSVALEGASVVAMGITSEVCAALPQAVALVAFTATAADVVAALGGQYECVEATTATNTTYHFGFK